MYAICHLSTVPVRSLPNDKAEMTTQLLFGEVMQILHKKEDWVQIQCLWDNQEGWVDSKQVKLVEQEELGRYTQNYAFSLEIMHPAMSNDYSLPIPMGAILPNFDGISFGLNGTRFMFSGQALTPNEDYNVLSKTQLILKIARRYLYTPYLAGGRSPFGIDSSGFTQLVFKMAGIALPRDKNEQVLMGETVDFVQQAQSCDLAFFENTSGKVTHVGILMDKSSIIHAYGFVRIDTIDHYGIFNEETQRYTHRLKIVKRVF